METMMKYYPSNNIKPFDKIGIKAKMLFRLLSNDLYILNELH